MFPENETPETPEEKKVETPQTEETTPVPPVETTAPADSPEPVVETPETSSPAEEPAEESAGTEPVEAAPEPEGEAEATPPAAEPADPVEATSPPAEPAAEAEPPAADPPTPEAESAPVAPSEAPPASGEEGEAFELQPLPAALLPELEAVLKQDSGDYGMLEEATASDLIQLLDHFYQQENVLRHLVRVGIIVNSFNNLRKQEAVPDAAVRRFEGLIARFNEKRDRTFEAEKKAGEANIAHKRELIIKVKAVVEAKDPSRIEEIREAQDAWKATGFTPRDIDEELYKEYRALLDEFYEMREKHFELLDYDRRINLREKERLIEEARQIVPPEEQREDAEVWKEAMDKLSDIQKQWKDTGHVPREDMDRINGEYRQVVDHFFEVRQGFMAIQEKLREEYGEKKQALLEKMLPFKEFKAEKPRAWNERTRELRAIQDEWKSLGQAPRSINSELWARYRDICNTFFSSKAEFFRQYDELRNENLEKKRVLVEEAEQLAESTDWEGTSKVLKRLQREWREIGPVPERHSNRLWSRFRAACDTFFKGRRSHYQDLHKDEYENLDAKKALIEQAKQLSVGEDEDPEAAIQKVKELQAQWKEIGKVPYKEKDKVWDEFRGTIDAFFDSLSMKREERRALKMRTSVAAINDPDRRTKTIKSKISRIRRRVDQSQEKIDQYSTNIQLISKGKSGDSLRKQIQDEIDKEKQFVQELKAKVKMLNDLLKHPPEEDLPDSFFDDDDDEPGKEKAKPQAAAEGKAEQAAPEPEAKVVPEPKQDPEAAAESKAPEPEAKTEPSPDNAEDTAPKQEPEAAAESKAPEAEAKAEPSPDNVEETAPKQEPEAAAESKAPEPEAKTEPSPDKAEDTAPKQEPEAAPAEETNAEEAPADDAEDDSKKEA